MSPGLRGGTAVSRRRGGGGGGTLTWLTETSFGRPTFTPARTVSFTTSAGFSSALTGLTAGDLIQYTGSGVLTISASSGNVKVISSKNPASTTVIDLGCSRNQWDTAKANGNYVAIAFTGTTNNEALFVHDCSNLRIYGGDMTTGVNGGVAYYIGQNTHDCYFWDFYAHDTGISTLSVFPVTGAIHDNSIRGEVSGTNATYDPHTEKGTGSHGCNFGDQPNSLYNNTLILHVHDCPSGEAVQFGQDTGSPTYTGNTFYIKAVNMTFVAVTQVSANVLAIWGATDLSSCTAVWLEGTNIQGRVVDCHGWTLGTTACGLSVTHGRSTTPYGPTNQNTHLSSTEPEETPSNPYAANRAAVVYGADCI